MLTEPGEERRFSGWATVEVKDAEGELLPIDTIMPQMEKFMEMGGLIMLNHTNWRVGKVEKYERRHNDEADADGIYVWNRCFKTYPIHDEVWEALQKGEEDPEDPGSLNAMSIAGQFEIGEDGVATASMPMEISVTGPYVDSKAVNSESKIESVSRAKSGDKKNSKGDAVEPDEEKEKAIPEVGEKVDEKEGEKADAGAVPPAEETPPEGEAPPGEEKKAVDVESALANLNERVSRLEGVMNKLVEDEEAEGSTDAAIEGAEAKAGEGIKPETDAKSEDPTVATKEEVAKLSKELAEMQAKFSKLESAGIRRTAQSGEGKGQDSGEVAEVRQILGNI